MQYLKSLYRKVYHYKHGRVLFFFAFLFLINIPFFCYYAQDYITTLARFGENCDELVFCENIDIILNLLFQGRFKGVGYNFYSFGYGSIFWFFSSLVAIPFWLLESERGVIISLRMMTLLFSLGTLYLMTLILKDFARKWWHIYVPILFSFFSPLITMYSTFIHPEAMYSFFLALAFFYLYKDDFQFRKYYYFSIGAFMVAVSVKILAAVFGIVYLFYLFQGYKKINIMLLVKSFMMAIGSYFIQNIFLVFPMIFARYYRWVTGMSGKILATSSAVPFAEKISMFSTSYVNVYLFFIIVFFSVGTLIFCYQKKATKIYQFLVMALLVVFAYFLFCMFYTFAPFHYGIALVYFLSLVIGLSLILLEISNKFLVFRKCVGIPIVGFFVCLGLGNVQQASVMLIQPSGPSHAVDFAADLVQLRSFVIAYSQQNALIGYDLGLSVPRIKGKELSAEPLHIRDDVSSGKFDFIFLLKNKDNERLIALAEQQGCLFKKVIDGNCIEIYERPKKIEIN